MILETVCLRGVDQDQLLGMLNWQRSKQNGVHQARQFLNAARVNGLVVTKLDGTAKGGVAVRIVQELAIPLRYIGIGEGPDDLVDFDPDEFLEGLLPSAA